MNTNIPYCNAISKPTASTYNALCALQTVFLTSINRYSICNYRIKRCFSLRLAILLSRFRQQSGSFYPKSRHSIPWRFFRKDALKNGLVSSFDGQWSHYSESGVAYWCIAWSGKCCVEPVILLVVTCSHCPVTCQPAIDFCHPLT